MDWTYAQCHRGSWHKLPILLHFCDFAGGTILLSGIVSLFDLEVIHPGTKEVIRPFSLLSIEGLHMI